MTPAALSPRLGDVTSKALRNTDLVMTASPLSYGPFISRRLAREQGLKHYYTGKACKRGHFSKRLVNSSHCCKCLIEKNKEIPASKLREYGKTYYDTHKAQRKAANKRYAEQNQKRLSAYQREYYHKNKEHKNEQSRK